MKNELVKVEIDGQAHVVTIFKSDTQAYSQPIPIGHTIVRAIKSVAVEDVRRQVYKRQKGKCLKCDGDITWDTMHLDEEKDRGKGGLVSRDNCRALCADCHIGPRGKHGLSRSPRWKGYTGQ